MVMQTIMSNSNRVASQCKPKNSALEYCGGWENYQNFRHLQINETRLFDLAEINH